MKKMPMRYGVLSPTWEKRYVVLKGYKLSYKRPDEENDRMTIDIRDVIVSDEGNKIGRALMGQKKGLHHIIGITVKSTGKELKFSTEDANEAEEWLYLIQEAGAVCYIPNADPSLRQRNIKKNTISTPSSPSLSSEIEKDIKDTHATATTTDSKPHSGSNITTTISGMYV